MICYNYKSITMYKKDKRKTKATVQLLFTYYMYLEVLRPKEKKKTKQL